MRDVDLALTTDTYNTIPSSFVNLAVTSSPALFDLNALGLGGKRVRLTAIGANITFLAGDHTGDPLAAGAGMVLATGAVSERFFVPTSNALITAVAGGSCTLRVFYGD